MSKIEEIMRTGNKGGLKLLVPLFHKIFGMMFAEMQKNKIDPSWYKDTLGALLAAAAFMIYRDPVKDFTKYTDIVDKEYEDFADDFDNMPSA